MTIVKKGRYNQSLTYTVIKEYYEDNRYPELYFFVLVFNFD